MDFSHGKNSKLPGFWDKGKDNCCLTQDCEPSVGLRGKLFQGTLVMAICYKKPKDQVTQNDR